MTEKERRFLAWIRDSIEHIYAYRPATEREFLSSPLEQDAITWRLQTIADAARNHLSDELKGSHPEIDWHAVYGFRNVAAHQYADIDLDIIWSIISQDLDPLLATVQAELAKES